MRFTDSGLTGSLQLVRVASLVSMSLDCGGDTPGKNARKSGSCASKSDALARAAELGTMAARGPLLMLNDHAEFNKSCVLPR